MSGARNIGAILAAKLIKAAAWLSKYVRKIITLSSLEFQKEQDAIGPMYIVYVSITYGQKVDFYLVLCNVL